MIVNNVIRNNECCQLDDVYTPKILQFDADSEVNGVKHDTDMIGNVKMLWT